jgi:two-component system, OmpR family, sensor histidine kinase KdpD
MSPATALHTSLGRRRPTPSELAGVALEVVAAVALATGIVALLETSAPAGGLGVIYLLAVLAIAVRHGQLAALTTAVVSVLTLNYFFIAPRHQLSIAHSQDLVVLVVLLIAAVVVGRLAAAERQRSAEAESRAGLAAAREREAKLLAEAASAILASRDVKAQLRSIGARVASATGASAARVALESVPAPCDGELLLPLPAGTRAGWLYVSPDGGWSKSDLERICEPLGRMIEVALERERVAEQAAEAEGARRAEVAKTAVLHAISHDLRSPLTAMTTAGAALRAPGVTATESAELIDVIETEGARLARLVDDLLDLSRLEADAAAPRADWCDLGDAVATAASSLGAEHPIEFALPADLPLVRADAAQLERVFSNLIENAVKFSPPGAPVRVTGGIGGGSVTIRISDRGRGIPPLQRARVFEPFFRGRGAAGPGSGLGLAICRGFVEANGGRIVLQSDAERGTSFAVSFPLLAQPVSPTAAAR